MKKFLTAAVAMAVLAGSAGVASAQSYGGDRNDHRYDQRQDQRSDGRYDDRGQRSDDRYDDRQRGDRYDNRGDRYDQRGDSRWGQERGGHHQQRHWRRGDRMDRNEWAYAQRYDYRRHNLRAPPRGYEWRQTRSGDIILAALATGLIIELFNNNNGY